MKSYVTNWYFSKYYIVVLVRFHFILIYKLGTYRIADIDKSVQEEDEEGD